MLESAYTCKDKSCWKIAGDYQMLSSLILLKEG